MWGNIAYGVMGVKAGFHVGKLIEASHGSLQVGPKKFTFPAGNPDGADDVSIKIGAEIGTLNAWWTNDVSPKQLDHEIRRWLPELQIAGVARENPLSRFPSRNGVIAIVLVVILSLGVFVTWRIERDPVGTGGRRSIPAAKMISGIEVLPFAGPLHGVTSTGPSQVADVLPYSPTQRNWQGTYHGRPVYLTEYVIAHHSVQAAVRDLRKFEPRKAALVRAGGSTRIVGPYLSTPLVKGRPDISHYFCEVFVEGACAAWTWSARYGQYVVKLMYLSLYPEKAVPMSEHDFVGVIVGFSIPIDTALR